MLRSATKVESQSVREWAAARSPEPDMLTSAVPVLDAAYLDRRSLGDESLKVELLALFVAEVERLLNQVETAANAQVRADRLRAIAALARNVGALRLAQSARMLETQFASDDVDLGPLRESVAEILAYLGGAGS